MKKQRYFQKIIDRINFLAEEQRKVKPQRKRKGDCYSPSASSEHFNNRFELRHLHIAYDGMRGRPLVFPKNKYFHQPTFNKLLDQYTPVGMRNETAITESAG